MILYVYFIIDNTTDMKMIEILAGLADDQSQSRTSQSVLPDPGKTQARDQESSRVQLLALA